MSTAASPSRALAWWQLLRAANVFTAASNVIAGFLIVRHSWRPAETLALLIGSSACLYLAGMVLNDVYDAELDAAERPERPIPAGHIPRTTASSAGYALLASGVLLSWLASMSAGHPMPGLIGILLAYAIVRYDRVLKSTWAGPLAMGWCRFLNVLLGASVALHITREGWAIGYAVAIGLYTILLTHIARSEAVGEWARRLRVRGLVTRMIQGFIVLDAVAAALGAGWQSGLIVLTLLIPTLLISRRAPMT
jgi:4-hydroxybenzoate polyprenyltransferase